MQDNSNELWIPVGGYEARYSVSNLGRVRRESGGQGARAGRYLRPNRTPQGYVQVTLYDGTGRAGSKNFTVHSLVAAAFLPPRPEGMEPNHINGIKNDNRADNLEWLTHAENANHAVRTGLRKTMDDELVQAIRNAEGAQIDIAIRFGVSQGHVSRIRRGRRSGSSKIAPD